MTTKKGVTLKVAYCLCVMVCAIPRLCVAKDNHITLEDILDWADNMALKKTKPAAQLTLDQIQDSSRHGRKPDGPNHACAERVIEICDLRPMARLLMDADSPCTLLKEYQMCLAQESRTCPSGAVSVLRSAVTRLVEGLQASGHCALTTLKLNHNTHTVKPRKPCASKATWLCTVSWVEDLKKGNDANVCSTLAHFRHCVHTATAHCRHHATLLLQSGARGLSRLYRRNSAHCDVIHRLRHTT